MTEKALPNAGEMILVPEQYAGYTLFRVVKIAKQMWQLERWSRYGSGGWGQPTRKYVSYWHPITGDPEKIQSALDNFYAQKNHAIRQAGDQYATKVAKLSENGA